MQLSCWHNIKAADYGHLIEGNENYDQLAQKQICDPEPDENITPHFPVLKRILNHDMGIFFMWVEDALITKSRISFLLSFCFERAGAVLQFTSCPTEWTWAARTIAGLIKGWWERDRLKLHVWTRNVALALMSSYAPHSLTPSRAVSDLWRWWNGLFHKTVCFKQFVLKTSFALVVCILLFAFSVPGY